MSNYRRLISYIYAYEGGIKGKNVGFAKLEVKNGQCKIHVNVRNVYIGSQDTGVYLLSDSSEIFIGKIFIRNGAGEFRIMVSVGNVAGSNQSIDQCYGLTVHNLSDSWQSYTTIWEDAVAHAAEVVLEEATSEHIEKTEKQLPKLSLSTHEKGRPSSISEMVEAEIEEQSRQEEQKKQREQNEALPSSVIPSSESISPQILRPAELEVMEIRPMEVIPIAGKLKPDTENEKPVVQKVLPEKPNVREEEKNDDTTSLLSEPMFVIEKDIEDNSKEHPPDTDENYKHLTENPPEKTTENTAAVPEHEKVTEQKEDMQETEISDFLKQQPFPAEPSLEKFPSIPPMAHPMPDLPGGMEQPGQQEGWGQQSPLPTQAVQQFRQTQQNQDWWFPTGRTFPSNKPPYPNRQPYPMQRGQQPSSGHHARSVDPRLAQEPKPFVHTIPQNRSEQPLQQIPPGQLSRPVQPPRSFRMFPSPRPNTQQQNLSGSMGQMPREQTAFPFSPMQADHQNLQNQTAVPDLSVPHLQQGQRNQNPSLPRPRPGTRPQRLSGNPASPPIPGRAGTSQPQTSLADSSDKSQNTTNSTSQAVSKGHSQPVDDSTSQVTANPKNPTTEDTTEHISETASKNTSQDAQKDTTEIKPGAASSTVQPSLKDISHHAENTASKTIANNTAKVPEKTASQSADNKASKPVSAANMSQAELEEQQREQLKQLEQSNLEEEPNIDMIWQHFYKRYPKIQAFDYNGGCEILTIKPQDIGLLPRETWGYGNNSFLLHGYYNHRYLIFARLNNPKGEARFLLGVPGHYYSSEKYMAAMFGFPNFVLSKVQPAGDGRFGYWYTDVHLGS